MVEEAIRSVLAQDYQPIEIIVVDDGSTDDTPQKLALLAAEYSQIVLLKQDNSGPGAARELGRLHAQGEYIQYLDSDDLLYPEKFSKQVSALLAQPACGAAYGKTECQFGDRKSDGIPVRRTGEVIATMFPSILKNRWWCTSTPLFRRTTTDRIGAWLPLSNEEDWEYDCRAAALGTKLAYVDDLVSTHRLHHQQHLSSEGASDPIKLRHRAQARASMYLSAQHSKIEIPTTDMQYFAKSAFLLARQCAAAGVDDCAQALLTLAITANQGATIKHRVFAGVGRVFGWRAAAKLATLLQK